MPFTGNWVRANAVPYASAAVWGTGYNPIHEFYGSPNVRMDEIPGRQGDSHAPRGSVPQQLINPQMWGYTLEDSASTDVTYDGRPSWNEQPEEYRGDSDDHPPYTAPQAVNERFRALKMGAHRFRQKLADSLPSETVSEGWLNKPKGSPANSKTSDPSQYEMQTSMQQRYRTRNNDASVSRATDDPRSGIDSRVTGQKLKVYSEGERHYDMEPREQDAIPRAFYYRTAGTGPVEWLEPNEEYTIEPLQREAPQQPAQGQMVSELDEGPDYGYTGEDLSYA